MNWFLRSGDAQLKLRRLLRRYRLPVLVLVGLLAIGITQTGLFKRFLTFQKLEHALLDFRFHQRGFQPDAPGLAMIGVDSSSFDPGNVGEEDRAQSEALQLIAERPFPWNRKVYALLLDRLFAMGARAVALDFVFKSESEGDAELAAALEKYADRVVIAATMAPESDDRGDNLIYLGPHDGLLPRSGKNVIGIALLHTDVDGVIRRASFRTSIMREHGRPELSDGDNLVGFAALAVEKATGKPAPGLRDQLINYQGPRGKYPHLPIETVFIDRLVKQSKNFEFGEIFRDKLVFVGPFAELFHDDHNTPYGIMAGVEIHANIAGDLLRESLLRDVPGWVELPLTVAMVALAVGAAAVVAHALWQTGILAVLGLGYFVVAQWLFTDSRTVIPMVAPLFAFTATGLVAVVFEFLLEQWERARIRSTLDRYVSKNVAEVVLADADSFEASLRGTRKCVTTLFSDIRGFTSMTESADADELVAQLNEYFLKMVDAVMSEGGTLQKFIGDAIMAVWGDTHSVSFEEDASRAVRAALRMRARLAELNAGWEGQRARVPLKTGLGIAHAEVVVGNIGHPKLRMEFTVLGDGVNTAARLESATKQFGCDIMVEAGVEKLTRGKFVYRQVDLLKLKGKTKTVAVFTPLSDAATPPPPWLADYHRAIGLYRGREFAAAAELFTAVNVILGGDDFLCRMYLGRCREMMHAVPAEDWDGSYVLSEK
jgi:adenylate cyclase